MIFSEKLQALRKRKGYSQEYLAGKCNVSRQAVSRWESNSAYPELEKLLYLSELFGVTVDYLVKDSINEELELNKKDYYIDFCGKVSDMASAGEDIYCGIIIKESISNELILDLIEIEQVEIWKTQDVIKYWTVIYFTSHIKAFPQKLSTALTGNWFVDMKIGNAKIIVFKDKVLTYEIGNEEQKERVIKYCREMGIPDEQMNWPE